MTDIRYTEAQAKAIATRGTNLLISAAAGAGKTQVLIDRIVQLVVQDEVPLKEMVVVTFTNAAAGEMKVRLQQGLSRALQRHPEKRGFLARQLRELPGANVSTLHAYCTKALRTYYHILDLEPDFRVLNDATRLILRENALAEAFAEAYENEEKEFLDAVAAYGGRRNDEELMRLVLHLANDLQSMPDPEAWLAEALELYARGDAPISQEDPFFMALWGMLTEMLEQGDILWNKMADILPLDGPLSPYQENLTGDAEVLEDFRDILHRAKGLDDLFALTQPVKLSRLKCVSTKKLNPDEAMVQGAYKGYREQFRDLFGETLSENIPLKSEAQVLEDRRAQLSMLHVLQGLAARFQALYTIAKNKRNAVDYNDLEHGMLRILADDAARESLRQGVRYIFFDEYQDCNPVQEAIVDALAPDNGLFYVGDVKQAIYRFRYADPGLFNDRYKRYRDTEDGELIHLADNFRSVAPILRFCNALFYDLMRSDLGDVDYREPGQALIPHKDENLAEMQPVQIVALDKENLTTNDWDPEAVWIAKEIRRLVSTGAAEYSDIAVLIRSPGTRLLGYEKAFNAMGVPYYSDNSVVNFDHMEVRLFMDMLQVIGNDRRDLPLAAVLLSPFGGLQDADLAAIRIAYPEGTLSEGCRRYEKEWQNALGGKLGRFYRQLAEWRHRFQREPLVDVADALLQESGYGAFLIALEEGEDRYENVQAFINRMGEYEADSESGLQGFLLYAETLRQRRGDSLTPAVALTAGDNRVQIMSIHKSKGLGFSVVFLADLSHRFNYGTNQSKLSLHRSLGLSLKVVDLEASTIHAPFESRLIAERQKAETRSEEVRLLYVALTRAKQQLYLVTADKNIPRCLERRSRGSLSYELKKGGRFQDWLFALIGRDNNETALSLENMDTPQTLYAYQALDAAAVTADLEHGEVPYLDPEEGALSEECREEIGDKLGYVYPYLQETLLPFKTTVTEITREEPPAAPLHPGVWRGYRGKALEITKPKFLAEEIHFTAAEKGTILHKVMQLIPLHVMGVEDVEAALDEMVQRALLTPAERAGMEDVELITNFFESDLGHQVCKAQGVEREVSFTMRYGGYLVDGQIDLIFQDGAGWHILDFKSDRDMVPERYTMQMDLYRRAVEKARDIKVTSVHLFWMRHGVATQVPSLGASR